MLDCQKNVWHEQDKWSVGWEVVLKYRNLLRKEMKVFVCDTDRSRSICDSGTLQTVIDKDLKFKFKSQNGRQFYNQNVL